MAEGAGEGAGIRMKKVCLRGHALIAGNLYVSGKVRRCRRCILERGKRLRRQVKRLKEHGRSLTELRYMESELTFEQWLCLERIKAASALHRARYRPIYDASHRWPVAYMKRPYELNYLAGAKIGRRQ